MMDMVIYIRLCAYDSITNCLSYETVNRQFFDNVGAFGATVIGTTRRIDFKMDFKMQSGGTSRLVLKSAEPVMTTHSKYTDCLLIVNLI